jgi:hypothetical protein
MKKFTFLSILLLLSACACFNYTRATIRQGETATDISSSEPSFAVTSLSPAAPFASGYTPAQLTATAQASNPPKPTPFTSGYTPAQLTATAQASNPPKPTPFTSGYTPAQLTATAQASNPPKPTPFTSGYTPAQLTATAQASNPPKRNKPPKPTPFTSGYTPAQLTATAQASNPPKRNKPPKPTPFAPGHPTIMQCKTTHTTNKAQTFSGILAYTRYNIEENGKVIHTPDNVKQVSYTYTNGKLTLSTGSTITTLAGADGIVTLPDGSLIIGGEGTTWKVNPKTGTNQTANPGGSVVSDHVTYDRQNNVVWTSGDNPLTTLSKIPVSPFGNGTPIQLKGDDTVVSAVAFDGSHNAYYTSSDIQGNGTFGVLNLTTFTTTRKISHLPAAHGIIYDPFTNTLLLAGANHITQIDPKTFKIVSDWTAPTDYPGIQLDQDTTDGLGHILVASNDGNLVFIDFSKTRKIAARTNYVSIRHLDTDLDDMTLECLNK